MNNGTKRDKSVSDVKQITTKESNLSGKAKIPSEPGAVGCDPGGKSHLYLLKSYRLIVI